MVSSATRPAGAGSCTAPLSHRPRGSGARDGRGARGAGDEAEVEAGQTPAGVAVARLTEHGEAGPEGLGQRRSGEVALGVVSGGDEGAVAVVADLGVVDREALVVQVARGVAAHPGRLGQGEAQRADADEVVGQHRSECGGVTGLLGFGPPGQEVTYVGIGAHDLASSSATAGTMWRPRFSMPGRGSSPSTRPMTVWMPAAARPRSCSISAAQAGPPSSGANA